MSAEQPSVGEDPHISTSSGMDDAGDLEEAGERRDVVDRALENDDADTDPGGIDTDTT